MSFSKLLRNSKISSYTPAIDQIYTSTPSTGFGLKRPVTLPGPGSAPYIRVNALDSIGKRTLYRKGTKEVKYTQKWNELDVGIAYTGDQVLEKDLQSHYLPESTKGGIATEEGRVSVAEPQRRVTNYFKMEEVEFNAFLSSLEGRREEFKNFLANELSVQVKTGSSDSEVNLFAHAQNKLVELNRTIEKFLAIPTSSSNTFKPLPAPHPSLALKYSNPTDLESYLSPPVPGRLLTQDSTFQRSATLATILGQVSAIPSGRTSSASVTTWYPDEGPTPTRSNIPGRTTFKLKPRIKFNYLITQLDDAASRGKTSPTTSTREVPDNKIESQTLAGMDLDLQPTVFSTRISPAVGSQAFTGDQAQDSYRSIPVTAASALDGFRSNRKGPRDLTKSQFSGEEKRERRLTTERLVQTRNSQGGSLYSKSSRAGNQTDKLLSTLDSILSGEPTKKGK